MVPPLLKWKKFFFVFWLWYCIFLLCFPMETLFVALCCRAVKKISTGRGFFQSPYKMPHIICSHSLIRNLYYGPDIVITRKHDNAIFICDTKWKLLSSKKVNWGNLSGRICTRCMHIRKIQCQKHYNALSND